VTFPVSIVEPGLFEDGRMFDGSSISGWRGINESDMVLLPDPETARYPLALASSSNRPLIEAVLERAGLAACFKVTVSSEEVARGKPAPDVYLEAARRLDVDPASCAAVEDSHGGIRSAKAAGMRVLAIPNPSYPPDEASLAQADVVLRSLAELTPGVVSG